MKHIKEWPPKFPAYALEYLKLHEYEESWAFYHNTHTLAEPEAWEALREQREKVKALLEKHIYGIWAALPGNKALEQVTKAAAAYEKLLDGCTKLAKKSKGKG